MKKSLVSSALIVIALFACTRVPAAIPTGTWKYRLLVNGAAIGSATVTSTARDNLYITVTEMEMNMGVIKNTYREVITETSDFRPVMLETYNKTIQGDKVNSINTIAKFNGNNVELDTGESKTTITIDKPFVLEGNYFFNELIKCGFKEGSIVKHLVYEPSVEIDAPVLFIIRVLGREEIEINGVKKKCIHIGSAMQNMKNVDTYIDENGIALKSIIVMLNNRFELILE